MGSEATNSRLFLGNLPMKVTKEELENLFRSHGKITEIKVLDGYGFVEFSDPANARDVVSAFHGTDFQGRKMNVELARGPRAGGRTVKESGSGPDQSTANGPRRTPFRMKVSGLPENTSWQDLKDFARQSSLDIIFTEVSKSGDTGIVDFASSADLRTAIEELNNRVYKNCEVKCSRDVERRPPIESRLSERAILPSREAPYLGEDRRHMAGDTYRFRSRSPPPVRGRYAMSPYQTYEQHYPYYREFVPANAHRCRSRSPDYAPREYEYRPLLPDYSRRSSPGSSYNSYGRIHQRVSPDHYPALYPPPRSHAVPRRGYTDFHPYYPPGRKVPPPPSPDAPEYEGDGAEYIDPRYGDRRASRQRMYPPDDRMGYDRREDDYW